jgi:hypothetical protein
MSWKCNTLKDKWEMLHRRRVLKHENNVSQKEYRSSFEDSILNK